MIAWRLSAIAVALAGCGRIHFDDREDAGAGDAGADGTAGAMVSVEVLTDSDAAVSGMPVVGADLVIERAGGLVERTVTDAAGNAQIAAPTPTTFHVVYPIAGMKARLYTIQAATAGATIRLGGRSPSGSSHDMTLLVAANSAGDTYSATGPDACAISTSGSTTLAVAYDVMCEGRTVHMYGEAHDMSGTFAHFTDLGPINLASGSAVNDPTVYVAEPIVQGSFTGLPLGPNQITAQALALSPTDLTTLSSQMQIYGYTGAQTALADFVAPAATTALHVTVSGSQLSTAILPVTIAGANLAVDASSMMPIFSGAARSPDNRSVSWTGPSAGTLIKLDDTVTTTGGVAVHWTAYVDPGVSSVALPSLPADLAFADAGTTGTWSIGDLSRFEIPGESAMASLAFIDAPYVPPAVGTRTALIIVP